MSKIVQFLHKLEKEKRDAADSERLAELELERLNEIDDDDDDFKTNLIPIASGKGGVGKTNFSVNLSLALAEEAHSKGKKVVLMDCDFGLPNADLLLGVTTQFNIHHFLKKKTESLAAIVADTKYPGLQFLSGAPDAPLSLANLNYNQRKKFMRHIKSLHAEYVLMDLGASAHHEILDFFSMANSGILVVNPEPTSTRDAFLFIKNAIFRKLLREFKDHLDIIEFIKKFENPDDMDIVDMDGLINEIGALDEGSTKAKVLKTILETFSPKIVVNRIQNEEEGQTTMKNMKDEAFRYLKIKLQYLGSIYHDEKVVRAIKESLPLYVAYPESKAAKSIMDIKNRLVQNEEFELEKNYFSISDYLFNLFRQKPETQF